MKKMLSLNIVLMIVISLSFLFLGHSLILQRTLKNTSESMTIRGDTGAYVAMIEGNWNNAPSPYKFRILVPFLASLLPFSSTDSLRFISYLSLFFCYLFIFLTCTKLRLNTFQSAVGLLTVWATTWHLYNYHNPFLTDAFGLLMLCIMIFAFLNDSFFIFLAAVLLGILARETTIFLVPIWLLKKRKWQNILVISIALIALFVPRLFLTSTSDIDLISNLNPIANLFQLSYLINVFKSWGVIWFLSLIGLLYLPKEKIFPFSAAFFCLLLGAFLSSLVAIDTGRMFSILAPIFAISCAQLFTVLFNKKRFLAFILLGLIIMQIFVSIPNIIFVEGSWIFGFPRYILLAIELFFVVLTFVALRESLKPEMREKARYIIGIMKRPDRDLSGY